MRQIKIEPQMHYRCLNCNIAHICREQMRIAYLYGQFMFGIESLPDGMDASFSFDCKFFQIKQSVPIQLQEAKK